MLLKHFKNALRNPYLVWPENSPIHILNSHLALSKAGIYGIDFLLPVILCLFCKFSTVLTGICRLYDAFLVSGASI